MEEDWGDCGLRSRRLGTQSVETAREIPRRLLHSITVTQLLLSWDVLGTPCRLSQVFFSPGFCEDFVCSFGLLYMLWVGICWGFFHLSLSVDY